MAAADGNREINRVYKMQELCKAVKSVAEADPVKHGKWEDIGETYAKCSCCGWMFEKLPTPDGFIANNRYCRYCGARMDKGE